MSTRRTLPWMAPRQQAEERPQHHAWHDLSSALARNEAVGIISALHALVQDRQSIGNTSPQQAQLATQALAWSCSLPTTGPGAHPQDPQLLALALLSRWGRQLTQRAQPDPASQQQLRSAVELVLRCVKGPMPAFHGARVQAAALLFFGTAFPGCAPQQQQAILSAVCDHLLRPIPIVGPGGVETGPEGGGLGPLSQLSACYDACAGVELLLTQVCTMPHSSAGDHPALALLQALTRAAVSATHRLIAAGEAGLAPDIAAHVPIQFKPQHLIPALQPNPYDIAQLGQRSSPSADSEENLEASGLLPPGLGQQVALQVAVRLLAAVGAALERWGTSCARSYNALSLPQASALMALLHQTAVRMQSDCSHGLQQCLRGLQHHQPAAPPVSTAAAAVPAAAAAADPRGRGLAGPPAGPTQQRPRIWATSVTWWSSNGQPAPGSPPPVATRLQGAVTACGAMLGSAGLLRGLVTGLRDAKDRQGPGSLANRLQPILQALAGTVQSCLAAVCRHQQEQQQQQQQARLQSPPATGRAHHPAHQLLRWCCGDAYAGLTIALESSGLQHLVAVPGPLAVRLPAMVVDCLLGSVLTVDALLLAVLQRQPPAVAGAWLREQAEADPMYARVPALARCVVSAAAQGPQLQQGQAEVQQQQAGDHGEAGLPSQPMHDELLSSLHTGVVWAGKAYAALALAAPPGLLDQLASPPPPAAPAPLRSLLDKLYVAAVVPLPALVAAAAAGQGARTPDTQAHTAAHALAVAAAVQFCAVQLETLSQPLAQLVPLALAVPAGAAELLAALPCYDLLIRPIPIRQLATASPPAASQPGGHAPASHTPHSREASGVSRPEGELPPNAPRWMVDAVLGAQLAFLLPIAGAAACTVPDAPAAADELFPLLFLLLKHPQAALATTAHSCLASLISHLCKHGHTDLARRAAPYYVERSLQQPWSLEQLEALEKNLPQVLHSLPSGCHETMYCLRYITCQAVHWYRSNPDKQALDFAPLYLRPKSDSSPLAAGAAGGRPNGQQEPANLQPEARFMSTVCGLLLIADWPLLPRVAEMVAEVVQAAAGAGGLGGRQQQVALLQLLHDMIVRSDDYVRKGVLMDWLQGLLSTHGNAQTQGGIGRGSRQASLQSGVASDVQVMLA